MSHVWTLPADDCPHLAAVRHEYADWYWFRDDKGYVRYTKDSHLRYEHRLVAERAYGAIPAGHHVHHINENKADNAAENLAIVSLAEHNRIHARRRTTYYTITCEVCGAEREVSEYRLTERNVRFCSARCRDIGNRKVKRPSRQKLAQLIEEVGNWSALGRMFGVSDNTVKTWSRRYKLI